MKSQSAIVLAVVALLFATQLSGVSADEASDSTAFKRTWQYTDEPVASNQVSRTWAWGPAPLAGISTETYLESPLERRAVQYFDKSRMEITQPDADNSASWYVTNGLLVRELATGQLQVGDAEFVPLSPALINVAGDLDDPVGATYATVGTLFSLPAAEDNAPITERVNRQGTVVNDPALLQYNVTAAQHVDVPGINHQVASVFWTFMTSVDLVYDAGLFVQAKLFENPFYATGFPITEPYWTTVRVGGTPKDVLLQCFERRCLTFTPENEPGWQVEAGNVGLHYYLWRNRHSELSDTPVPTPGNVTFNFGGAVSEADRNVIRNGVAYAANYIARHFGTVPDAAIAVTATVSGICGSGEATAVSDHAICVDVDHPNWVGKRSVFNAKKVAHAYIHLVHSDLGCEGDLDWFVEGSAEFVAYLALIDAGAIDYDTVRGLQINGIAAANPPRLPLPAYEQSSQPGEIEVAAYDLWYLAVEQLVLRPDIGSAGLFEYCQALGAGVARNRAFSAAFGQSITDFYAFFETYREMPRAAP